MFSASMGETFTAAVNVSTEDDGNFLADLDAGYRDRDDDDDDDDDDEPVGDFKTLLADLDVNGGFRPN